jgi:hypothetical protein
LRFLVVAEHSVLVYSTEQTRESKKYIGVSVPEFR